MGCASGSSSGCKQAAAAALRAAPVFLLAVVIGCATTGNSMAAAAPAASPALGGVSRAFAIDAIDACLFTCDYCFKGDVVVRCANTCIRTEAGMGGPWMQVCPYFYKHSAYYE